MLHNLIVTDNNSKIYNKFNYIWSYKDIEISSLNLCKPGPDCLFCQRFCVKKMIALMFYLKGENNLTMAEKNRGGEYHLPSGKYALHYNPWGDFCIEYPSDNPARILRILFPYQGLANLLNLTGHSSDLKNLLPEYKIINRAGQITPPMRTVVDQILDPSLHCRARYFFFTDRIIELADCFFGGKSISANPLADCPKHRCFKKTTGCEKGMRQKI